METLDVMKNRRSCRSFNDTPVEKEKLEQIVTAGQYAPNGMSKQSPTFVAVTNPDVVAKLSQLNAAVMGASKDPFYGGKAVIVVLVDTSVGTCIEDGSLAMGNMLNAAEALGVKSIWIHRAKEVFESEEGKALLAEWGLPADGSLRGVGNCVLGYSDAPDAPAKPRRDNVVYVE